MVVKETFIVELHQDFGKKRWITLAEKPTLAAARKIALKKRALGYEVRIQTTLGMGYLTEKGE